MADQHSRDVIAGFLRKYTYPGFERQTERAIAQITGEHQMDSATPSSLADYERRTTSVEQSGYDAFDRATMAAALRQEITGCLWRPWVRSEVDALLERLAQIELQARRELNSSDA